MKEGRSVYKHCGHKTKEVRVIILPRNGGIAMAMANNQEAIMRLQDNIL